MNRKKWILTAMLALLCLPVLFSFFDARDNNEPNGVRMNRYEDLSQGQQFRGNEPGGDISKAAQHRIPRKQYFGTNHVNDSSVEHSTKKSDVQSNVKQKVMDQILAEDLSKTTAFFITQMQKQLERWSDMDLSKQEAYRTFQQQLNEHQQFQSFGLLKNGKLQVEKGQLEENKLSHLQRTNASSYYSDPYMSNGKQCMLIGKKRGAEWVVGEVDLSFIKGFVGELASVADANGNFFISSDQENEVKWNTTGKNQDHVVSAKVPDLNWQIVLKSQGTRTKTEEFHDGEVLVQFANEESAKRWFALHQDYTLEKQFGAFVVISHPTQETNEIINNLVEEPTVVTAEPNYIFTKQHTALAEQKKIPNDEFFQEYQWNLTQIQAEEGWEVSNGSKNTIISYLDTGIDVDHEDLKDKINAGYNAFDKTKNFKDSHGHGTHVAGIIGAITNNVTGIAGVSWQNPIVPVKVLNEKGEGSIFEIASGIKWATDNGAQVINMSLGDSEHSELLYDAIRYAYERDVVLIAAAGNDNVETPMFPASYDEVLAVSAVNQNKQKAEFSNYGNHIDVAAPGENIPSTFLEDQYVFMSGTSMAAPHVSGFAGLIRSLRPDLSNDEVMDVIRNTATDIGAQGFDPYFGHGLINVQAALEYLSQKNEASAQERENQITPPRITIREWLNRLFR